MDELNASGDNESPIVYMDTDMMFEKYPHLFDETHFDYMGYNWTGDLTTSGSFNPIITHVSGGIMYFANNELGYNLLSKWCVVTANNPGKAEDRILSIIINNDPILITYRIMWLPGYYLWLEDKWESLGTRFEKNITSEDIIVSHPENLTSEEMATNNSSKSRSPILEHREYMDIYNYGEIMSLPIEIRLTNGVIQRNELYTDDENLYLTNQQSSDDNRIKMMSLHNSNLLKYIPFIPDLVLDDYDLTGRGGLNILASVGLNIRAPNYQYSDLIDLMETHIQGIVLSCVSKSKIILIKDHINTLKKKFLYSGILLHIYPIDDDFYTDDESYSKQKILAILLTVKESMSILRGKSLLYINDIENINSENLRSGHTISTLMNMTTDFGCQNFNYRFMGNDPLGTSGYCNIKSLLSLNSLDNSHILFRINEKVYLFLHKWYSDFSIDLGNLYVNLDLVFAKYNISQYFRCQWFPLIPNYNSSREFSIQCKEVKQRHVSNSSTGNKEVEK